MHARPILSSGETLPVVGLGTFRVFDVGASPQEREPQIDQIKQSIRLLKAGRIDLMQVHNLLDWEIHLETLRAWRAEGRMRYIGITHCTPRAFADLARVIEVEPIDFLQIPYSIGVRDAEDRLLTLAAEGGVAVLVNEPYDGGSLFRSVRGHELPPVAAEFGCASWGQYFLKFVLGHSAVTCVIPGTSKPKRLQTIWPRAGDGCPRGQNAGGWKPLGEAPKAFFAKTAPARSLSRPRIPAYCRWAAGRGSGLVPIPRKWTMQKSPIRRA